MITRGLGGPAHPEDVVAWVTVRQHSNGMISTSGHIGDRRFAISLLQHAIDAVRGHGSPDVVIPAYDTSAPTPRLELRELAHVAPADRGDP